MTLFVEIKFFFRSFFGASSLLEAEMAESEETPAVLASAQIPE